ncbi:MAG: Fur family transcriptional regulator [Armatimonadota bacterium]|jgi:Fe2+ or Zn2+ uptake regulation protein
MAGENDLTQKVHQAGGRMTAQCRAVLEALASVDTHPTAAEVYEMVREQLPDISQGTVYRNLHKLTELGYAQELDYGPGATHFDATVTRHYHVRCVECGRVDDLPIERRPAPCLDEAQEAADGWRISEHRVEFMGLCPDCRDNQ